MLKDNRLKLFFYCKANGQSPIYNFYLSLNGKVRAKILAYFSLLIERGNLGFPYARHIKDKIWELRVDFDKNYYRIFYFIFTKDKIILLSGFNKKTNKTPAKEIARVLNYYQDYLNNLQDKMYEF